MRGHILVATGSAEEARTLAATIGGWGYDVRCVSDGAEVEASVLENLPAALVLSLDLRPDGAVSFLRRGRGSFLLSSVAVVVLADAPRSEEAASALELGAVAVLDRSAPNERLREALSTAARPPSNR